MSRQAVQPGALSLAAALVLLACDPGALKPAEPAWGKQACAHCAMLLSDPRYAAQLTLDDGTRRYFDDVGCMVSFVADERLHPKAMWVRSAGGQGWTPAESAQFASGATTPMDSGFVTAASGLSFTEVRRRVLETKDRQREASRDAQ